MKTKVIFILFSLIVTTATFTPKVMGQALGNPVTLSEEVFSVPHGIRLGNGVFKRGVEKPFALKEKSEVSMVVASHKSKPSLNVYLLDSDNYAKYQASNSLTNLTPINNFSKSDTLGFEADGVLPAGKYVLLIQWAKGGFFVGAPAVALQIIARKVVEKVRTNIVEPIATSTPTFWKRIFK